MAKDTIKTVSDLLNENQSQLAAMLPKVITPARFMNLCVNVVQNDVKLHDCTAQSLVRCMFQAAQMGLTPGLRRQVYLVPYNNKHIQAKEAQLQIGYQGLLTLARRSGQISKIDAGYVMDGDTFEFSNGFDVILKHVQLSQHRRDGWVDAWIGEGDKRRLAQDKAWEHVTYVYSFAKLTNGERHLNVMTKEEIEWHRDRYSKAAHVGPWVENVIEMGQKTTLRELCNLLPSDEEDNLLGKAVALDRQLEEGQPQTIEVTGFHIPDEETSSSRESTPNGSTGKTSESAKPQAMKLPNFGHSHAKEKPIDHPDVTMDDLKFYLDVKEKDLGKPGRENFHDYDVKLIAAIKVEMERRRTLGRAPLEAKAGSTTQSTAKPANSGSAKDDKDAKSTKEPGSSTAQPSKSGSTPQSKEKSQESRELMTEGDWTRYILNVSTDYPLQFKQMKTEFKVKEASKIDEARRWEFLDKLTILIQEATGAATI